MGEKVGLVSCSGEDFIEGTVTRLATRKVMDELRPGKGVTICLPLFLAGGKGERAFARVNPTITIDGCSKLCAKNGTEMHSGKVNDYISVPDVLKGMKVTKENIETAVDIVAEEIVKKLDAILSHMEEGEEMEEIEEEITCSCFSSPEPDIIEIDGRKIEFLMLPRIFLKFKKQGYTKDNLGKDFRKEINIYNYISEKKEEKIINILKDYYDYFIKHGKMKGR